MSRPSTMASDKSVLLDEDHISDYFGGNHDMAALYLRVLESDTVSAAGLEAIAKTYFRGDLETARGFCALAQKTRVRCSEAEEERKKEEGELAEIAAQASAARRAKHAAKIKERQEKMGELAEEKGESADTDAASAKSSLKAVVRSKSFKTQSLFERQQAKEEAVQRTMKLLRALEGAHLETSTGPMQLQEAVRPRSYTHELLKNAGLKYRRGKPVFEQATSQRSVSSLSYLDGPGPSRRYREQGKCMAVVDRRARSTTPSLKAPVQLNASSHRQLDTNATVLFDTNDDSLKRTARERQGNLQSTRPRALSPLSRESKRPALTTSSSLSISLPILCKFKSSETASLMEAMRDPDENEKRQLQIEADLEEDEVVNFELNAQRRLKMSMAGLARKIAVGFDERSLLLNNQATHNSIVHHIVMHDGEARDRMRRVETILGDKYGIDIRQYGIPIRLTDNLAEIMNQNVTQKSRLNAHMLEFAPRATCVKSETFLPKGLGRNRHHDKDEESTKPERGFDRALSTDSDGASRGKLPAMEHNRIQAAPNVERSRSNVHRDVEELIVVRGMSSYQLSGEIAKLVGRAFLFLEYYDGLDASSEGAFCELCSYLWAKEEKAELLLIAAKIHGKLAELEMELAYVEDELKVLQKHVDQAHKEREEADEAELHAKKSLAAARDAVKYGWPGAQRKMEAAKQAEIDAARELQEAIDAEEKVIGKEYPEALEKQRHVNSEMLKERAHLAETESAMSAFSMYMLTQENNPHPILGDIFRKALLGLESVDGKMRVFLKFLKEHKQLIQPRPKTIEELEAEAAEGLRLQQEEYDRQAAAQRDELGTLFNRITTRLKAAPPGAPGMPAVLSYEEPFVHVTTTTAKTFDQEVMEVLDDKMRNHGTGELTSSELAEYCAMTIRGEHDPGYCFEVGVASLLEAKKLRFEGDLDSAEHSITFAKAALQNADDRAKDHLNELEFFEKTVERELGQLQNAVLCHQRAEAALQDGQLIVFRRYWDQAKSLYESCGKSAEKANYLPALLKWDEQVKLQEKDVKDMADSIAAGKKAIEESDMVVAAQETYRANSLIAKCGKAGMELSGQASELLKSVLDKLVEQRLQQEALCRSAINTEKFGSAEHAIVEIWKSCRLSAVALGEVQKDASDEVLVSAEKKQAKEQASPVVSLSEELKGTKQHHSAIQVLTKLNLLVWPQDDAGVLNHKTTANEALAHLVEGRKHLEAAHTESAQKKVLALQPVELDLAIRVHSNEIVKKLLTNAEKEDPNGSPYKALPFMCTAAAANNAQALQLLINVTGDVNLVDTNGNTPVHHAIHGKAWAALSALGKERKTNPNKINNDGMTPLHMAVLGTVKAADSSGQGMFRQIARTKTMRGKNLMTVSMDTKLNSSMAQFAEGVKILLKEFWKINPNTKAGKYESTALHLAGEQSNATAVELLLQSTKVDPNVRDNRGRSPLIAAVWMKKGISHFLKYPKVDVNQAIPKSGWSPLHVCIVKDSLGCMRELLNCDRVNVAAEDLKGFTPTHLAAYADSKQAINILMNSPAVQEVGGPKILHLLSTTRRFHEMGDPGKQGLWTQATRELLELLPSLLIELRIWDQLHDTLCNVSFAAAVIGNLGIDTAIALYATACEEIRNFSGVTQEITHDFAQYQALLENFAPDIRSGRVSFTNLAVDHALWGVRNAQHSVSFIIEMVDNIRAEVAAKTKKESYAFFECLQYKQELDRIGKISLQKILPSKRSYERAQGFIKNLYGPSNLSMEELEGQFLNIMQSAKPEDKNLTIEQLSMLMSTAKNQKGVGALKVVMKTTIEVSKIRSRICEELFNVVPKNEKHVLVRVVRIFEHLGKVVAIVLISKNPVHCSVSFGEGRLIKTLNAIIDSFRGKSNDVRLKPVIDELKILSITTIEPSIFVVMDLIPPMTTAKRFKNKDEYKMQVLNDVRNACNLQPTLLRVCKVSENWNQIIIELLHDDINPSKSLEKNRIMAERLMVMSNTPSTVLHKGVITQHIASMHTLEGHVVPRFEGEWQEFQVHVVGSSSAMHNELKVLEEYILPAACNCALLHDCYLSWTIKHDDMMSPSMKRMSCNLHDMEINKDEEEIFIGLVGDRLGSIVDINGRKTSMQILEMEHHFLESPDDKEAFVFVRELENLDGAGFPYQYESAVSDSQNPEAQELLTQFKGRIDRHIGRRASHYKPIVKGFRIDVDEVLLEAQKASENWDTSMKRLEDLKAAASDSLDVQFKTNAIKITEKRMGEMMESCGRWLRILYAENARGAVPSEILEAAKQVEEHPMFANQEEPRLDFLTPDHSEGRLAMGLSLDVNNDMFHVGLAIADSLKARCAAPLAKTPFHSHLGHREDIEVTRISNLENVFVEEGSSTFSVLEALEKAICPVVIKRAGSKERIIPTDGIERKESAPEENRTMMFLLTGPAGSGKTATLAVLSDRLLQARFQDDRSTEVPQIQVYFKLTDKHNFADALHYLNSEIALQLEGREGLRAKHSHRGDWEEEIKVLEHQLEDADNSVIFLLDGLDADCRNVLARLFVSLRKNRRVQCVMCAESGAGFDPEIVPSTNYSDYELSGLSQGEQEKLLSRFSERFHTRPLTDKEKQYVIGKDVAKNPLYLHIYAIVCIITPSWVQEAISLPGEVAKLFEYFVIPYLADWLRVPARVVEAVLEVAQMNPRGIRLSSLHLEVQDQLLPHLRIEASISKMSLMVALLSPVWRPSRRISGLIALEHSCLVTTLPGNNYLVKALHLADSDVEIKSVKPISAQSTPVMGLDTEDTDPKLLEILKILQYHSVSKFNLHCTKPIFLALGASGENWELSPEYSVQYTSQMGEDIERDIRAWGGSFSSAPSDLFNVAAICSARDDFAMDPCEALLVAFEKWNFKAEQLLDEYDLNDEGGAVALEASFDACNDQLFKVSAFCETCETDDLVVASVGLKMAATVWYMNFDDESAQDGNTGMNSSDREYSARLSSCWAKFQQLRSSMIQHRDMLERRCVELSEDLVIHNRKRWDEDKLLPSNIQETLGQLVYNVVVDFRGKIEMMHRRAVSHVHDGGKESIWFKLSMMVIREACEDLNKHLLEETNRITKMVARKREKTFLSLMETLRDCIAKRDSHHLHLAVDVYDAIRSCGHFPIEAIDKMDSKIILEGLDQLWNVKAQLDRFCDEFITHGTSSMAFGPAFATEDAIVGIPTLFIIQSKNKKGEALATGGESAGWNIQISDEIGPVSFDLTDNENGTYEVEFVPRFEIGTQVSISFRTGKKSEPVPIKGSPFTLRFGRDSFWSLKSVIGMPYCVPGRSLFAASSDEAFILNNERQEIYVMSPDAESPSDNVWKCRKGRLAGEDIGALNIKGIIALDNKRFLAYTNSLSSLDERFSTTFVLLEMKEKGPTLFAKSLVATEQDPPPELKDSFLKGQDWHWTELSCKTKNKVEEIPELPDSDEGFVPAAQESLATAEPQENLNGAVGSSVKAKFTKTRIKGSSNRYEDFSLPIIVATARQDEGKSVPVAMMMTHFDQYSCSWRKRASAVFCEDKLMVFGGIGERSKVLACYQSEHAETQKASFVFDTIAPAGHVPCRRCNFYLACMGKRIILHGGIDENEQVLNDLYSYDLEQHRWDRVLSMALPNGMPMTYAFGVNGVHALHRGTKLYQLRSLDMQKVLRRSSIQMCAEFTMQAITKARRAIREFGTGMNRRDSWLLRLTIYRALNDSNIESTLQNAVDMMTFLDLHKEEHGLDLGYLKEDLDEVQAMKSDMNTAAIKLRTNLKKVQLSDAPHIEIETCHRLRVQYVVSHDLTLKAKFACIESGFDKAMEDIDHVTKRLEALKEECHTFDEQVEFFGITAPLQKEKALIESQVDTLSYFRRAWNMHKTLFDWANMTLGHPKMQEIEMIDSFESDLQHMAAACHKFASSEICRELQQHIEDVKEAQRFVALLKLVPGKADDSWHATRIVFSLTQMILNPATVGSMLLAKTFQNQRYREFISVAQENYDDATSLVAADNLLLCVKKMQTGVHDLLDRSMYSETCFCEIRSVCKKSLPKRSDQFLTFRRLSSTYSQTSANDGQGTKGTQDQKLKQPPPQRDPQDTQAPELKFEVREIFSKARLGRIKEFKELADKDLTLYTATNEWGSNLMHVAATSGHKKIVKEIMRNAQHIDLYARDRKGRNALDLALEFKYHELADYLREKLPALVEPCSSTQIEPSPPMENTEQVKIETTLNAIRVDFTLHGVYPGAQRIPYLRSGTHANFVSYTPVKFKSGPCKSAGDPVDMRAWFIVGKEKGPWNFAYGDFTEVSLKEDAETMTTSIKTIPFKIGLSSETANAQVVDGHLSGGMDTDHAKVHYSHSEFMAEFAAYSSRVSEIKNVAERHGHEMVAEQTRLLANQRIVRDAMNRPVLVDGTARGVALCSIWTPFHRDALGRIVVTDGIERNVNKHHVDNNTADWRSRFGAPLDDGPQPIPLSPNTALSILQGDSSENVTTMTPKKEHGGEAQSNIVVPDLALETARAQVDQPEEHSKIVIPLSPTTEAHIEELTRSGRELLDALAESSSADVMHGLVKGKTLLAHVLCARLQANTSESFEQTPPPAGEGVGATMTSAASATSEAFATERHGHEMVAERMRLLANQRIVRDAMNRPVLVDGTARGVALYSIWAPYHRDALGRIVVTDGIERNAIIQDMLAPPPAGGDGLGAAKTSETVATLEGQAADDAGPSAATSKACVNKMVAEHTRLLPSQRIVRDAMNRPVLVDGAARGVALSSIWVPYHRDALGRIVVTDGIERNAITCETPASKGPGPEDGKQEAEALAE